MGEEDEYVETELQEDGAGERQRLYVAGDDGEGDDSEEAGFSLLEAARVGDSSLFFALLAAGAPVDAVRRFHCPTHCHTATLPHH